MNAIIFAIKGDLKPMALRHHVFNMGNTLGIRGFLNYKNGMDELHIHAEGEPNAMAEFTNQINQLTNEHKLSCSMESIILEDFTDFKISRLDAALNSVGKNIPLSKALVV